MSENALQELKRLQTELASSSLNSTLRSRHQARISDLLRLHGAEWAGPRAKASWKRIQDDLEETTLYQQFGPVFVETDVWQFRNGELASCCMSMADFLACGETLRKQTNLEELTLHGIGGQGLLNLRRARLEKCRRLNAPDVILQNEMQALAKAEQCCPPEKLLDCAALLGIKSLRFEHLGLFDAELEVFAEAACVQQAESLYAYLFSDANHEFYRKLGRLSRLRELDLEFYSDGCGDRGIDVGNEEDARLLASADTLRDLRVLRLRYHEVGDAGMLDLVRSEHLPSLQVLDLRGNYSSVTNAGLERLAAAPEAVRIRNLNLNECSFDNDGVLALAHSPYLQHLEELHVAPVAESYETWKKISGLDFVVALSEQNCLPSLRNLNIAHQMIGDQGIQALAQSPRFARFEKLVLTHQGLSDEGLVALANTPFPSRLQELNLRWNSFGDRGFAALCQSPLAPGVEVLYLGETPNTGSLLANSRFDNLVEVRVGKLDESILEPLAVSMALPSLRRLVFYSGLAPGELLQRKHGEPVHLLRNHA